LYNLTASGDAGQCSTAAMSVPRDVIPPSVGNMSNVAANMMLSAGASEAANGQVSQQTLMYVMSTSQEQLIKEAAAATMFAASTNLLYCYQPANILQRDLAVYAELAAGLHSSRLPPMTLHQVNNSGTAAGVNEQTLPFTLMDAVATNSNSSAVRHHVLLTTSNDNVDLTSCLGPVFDVAPPTVLAAGMPASTHLSSAELSFVQQRFWGHPPAYDIFPLTARQNMFQSENSAKRGVFPDVMESSVGGVSLGLTAATGVIPTLDGPFTTAAFPYNASASSHVLHSMDSTGKLASCSATT
jgi:hypothetical protein